MMVMSVRAWKMVRPFGTQKMRRKKSRAQILTPPRVVIEKKSKAMYNCSEHKLGAIEELDWYDAFDVIAAVSVTSRRSFGVGYPKTFLLTPSRDS